MPLEGYDRYGGFIVGPWDVIPRDPNRLREVMLEDARKAIFDKAYSVTMDLQDAPVYEPGLASRITKYYLDLMSQRHSIFRSMVADGQLVEQVMHDVHYAIYGQQGQRVQLPPTPEIPVQPPVDDPQLPVEEELPPPQPPQPEAPPVLEVPEIPPIVIDISSDSETDEEDPDEEPEEEPEEASYQTSSSGSEYGL
ncbi:hypothetical protein L1049_006613 [Liquidambar formosana]|uniref:Uncharacterized protein n=1 Tax=Liquidambar formosana TaxID=63359 RepID=A0AAP0WRM1_LIQFO